MSDDDLIDFLRYWAEATNFHEDRDALTQAADEIERLRADVKEMADWVVLETGYPVDMGADLPLPAAWRTPIEDAYLREADIDPQDPYATEFRRSIAEHGGWDNE